ncbi:MAG: sensor histidine kinase [Ignavibacteria bacterium]
MAKPPARSPEASAASVAEFDRVRVAERLHDDFLQLATGIALRAKALEKAVTQAAASAPGDAADIARAANGLTRRMRGLIADLRAAPLERGLPAALRDFALDRAAEAGIAVRLDLREVGAVDRGTALQLYRMAQEVLTAAVRHREARHISLALRTIRAGLALRVADDGFALDDERSGAAAASRAYLEMRAQALGAALRVRSPTRGGASIIIVASGGAPAEPR